MKFSYKRDKYYEEIIRENDASLFHRNNMVPANYRIAPGTTLYYDVKRGNVLKTGIKAVFTCKHVCNMDNKEGISVSDFKNIQKNFFSNERFIVVISFAQSKYVQTYFSIMVFDDYGRIKFENHYSENIKDGIICFGIHNYILSPGRYTIIAEVNGEIREGKQEIITIY
jgi:hypothetical protein